MLRRCCRHLGLCALTVAMCCTGGIRAQDAAHDVVITLERTACYGWCPVYKVTVTGDGTVSYEGTNFVRVIGQREAKIDPAAVKNLVKDFQDIHYFELQDEYKTMKYPDGTESFASDLPTAFTSISLNGKTKKIEAYYGVPDELYKLEKKIDEVTGSKRWVTIDAEQVREEVRRGWNVRSPEGTVLLVKASEAGDADSVKAFIDAGANVNANNDQETPIQVAGSAEVVRLLVAAGADVNGQTEGRNTDPALQHAARWDDAATVRELLKSGARIDARAWDGGTALMRAAEKGSPEIVSLLLAAGANVKLTNEFGSDAMMSARNGLINAGNWAYYGKKSEEVKAGFLKVREMLLKAGATESEIQQ
jgi:hypothetical protein